MSYSEKIKILFEKALFHFDAIVEDGGLRYYNGDSIDKATQMEILYASGILVEVYGLRSPFTGYLKIDNEIYFEKSGFISREAAEDYLIKVALEKTGKEKNMQKIFFHAVTTTDDTVTVLWSRVVSNNQGFTISGRFEVRKSDRATTYTCRVQAQFRRAAAGSLVLVGQDVDPIEDSSGTPSIVFATNGNTAEIRWQGILGETWNVKPQDLILTRI